jgi:hypothetical protein
MCRVQAVWGRGASDALESLSAVKTDSSSGDSDASSGWWPGGRDTRTPPSVPGGAEIGAFANTGCELERWMGEND